MTRKKCKGCVEFYRPETPDISSCRCQISSKIEVQNKTYSCPCIHCLVKSMCGESCEQFDIYTDLQFYGGELSKNKSIHTNRRGTDE